MNTEDCASVVVEPVTLDVPDEICVPILSGCSGDVDYLDLLTHFSESTKVTITDMTSRINWRSVEAAYACNDHIDLGLEPGDGEILMRVTITKEQAEYVDFYNNVNLVRSCFYLGMGLAQIKPLVFGGALYDRDRIYTLDTAVLLGMTDLDVVIVNESSKDPSNG